MTDGTQTKVNPPTQSGGKSKAPLYIGLFCCGCLGLVIIGLIIFGVLAFMGAKGQPGTVIKPSDVKTPKNLTATGIDQSIDISWQKSGSSNVTKYNVYKSTTSADQYQQIETVESTINLTYKDSNVQKGKTYYYVVTGVSTAGTESGNSNQTFYTLESPPLLPNGVQNWSDVLTKFDSDKKYADLLTKVTGLNRTDIEKFINYESQGKSMKRKLLKGTVIKNTTENYVILDNYTLTEDKWFLTDENGIAHIMVWCGNPMKLIQKYTSWDSFVENLQNITYNIIYIFPAPVTNTIIYASQPLSNTLQPQTSPSPTPTSDKLEEGEQWAVEGQLLVKAYPVDPKPGETVTITISLAPAEFETEIKYSVSGTDGYTDSGTTLTDGDGKINFTIPGSYEGVVDTIKVTVPSKNLEGSTEYTF